jgi:hypothetical protein
VADLKDMFERDVSLVADLLIRLATERRHGLLSEDHSAAEQRFHPSARYRPSGRA